MVFNKCSVKGLRNCGVMVSSYLFGCTSIKNSQTTYNLFFFLVVLMKILKSY